MYARRCASDVFLSSLLIAVYSRRRHGMDGCGVGVGVVKKKQNKKNTALNYPTLGLHNLVLHT